MNDPYKILSKNDNTYHKSPSWFSTFELINKKERYDIDDNK